MNAKPNALLVDVDGTLADVQSIRHYVEGELRDFDAFHRASIDVDPIMEVLDLVKSYKSKGFRIIAVSGRSERYPCNQ